MKRLFLVIALVFLSGSAAPQNVGNDPEHTVSRMLSCGCLEGHDDKVLGEAVTTEYHESVSREAALHKRNRYSPTHPQNVFWKSEGCSGPEQSRTRTALFVLRSFESYARDSASRKEVDDTRQYILGQSARSNSNPPSN